MNIMALDHVRDLFSLGGDERCSLRGPENKDHSGAVQADPIRVPIKPFPAPLDDICASRIRSQCSRVGSLHGNSLLRSRPLTLWALLSGLKSNT
jgi:hypothetical protein